MEGQTRSLPIHLPGVSERENRRDNKVKEIIEEYFLELKKDTSFRFKTSIKHNETLELPGNREVPQSVHRDKKKVSTKMRVRLASDFSPTPLGPRNQWGYTFKVLSGIVYLF